MEIETIAAAKFKEKCLFLLDHVGPKGIVITKHGRPVARLMPAGRESKSLLGRLKGKIQIHGGILRTGARWSVSAQS